MKFSQTEQDRVREIVARMKKAREKFSVASKVYQPYMAAVKYAAEPTEEAIVEHFRAHKKYCEEYAEFNAARVEFDTAMKMQGILTSGVNKQELKRQEQNQMIPAKQKAMALAILTRRSDESPQEAMERGEREFLAEELAEQQKYEQPLPQRQDTQFPDSNWSSVSEKDDFTLGDFEPLPETSIAAEPQEGE